MHLKSQKLMLHYEGVQKYNGGIDVCLLFCCIKWYTDFCCFGF